MTNEHDFEENTFEQEQYEEKNMQLAKLNDPSILEGFTEIVEKTIYISGKMWQERFEEGRPMKVIGNFRNTYQKWDELSSKMRNHHVLITPKGDVVINGYGDLDARIAKIPPGACIMIEYIGRGQAFKQGFTAPLKFEVRRNKALDMSPDDTKKMLAELEIQQKRVEDSKKPQVQQRPTAAVVARREEYPF